MDLQSFQTEAASFTIQHIQFINNQGYIIQGPSQDLSQLPPFARDPEHLKKLYSMMVKLRLFDTKAIALQRTGKMGTYASTLGQEAFTLGVGAAMKPQDILCPYYRDYGAQMWRGVSLHELLLYWGGDERGSNFKGPKYDFPLCVPIGTESLHAVGAALALKLRKQPHAVVVTIGDGGTSRGDFYEAINAAGVWKLPLVFVINNNQWAISVPREKQSGAKTLAQKGLAGGLFCEQVDGNDIIAVQYCVEKALERACLLQGASVIEALTYRMSDHTTADDAKRYRNEQEVEAHKKNDPLKRLYQFLVNMKIWDDVQEKKLYEALNKEMNEAVDQYMNMPSEPPESMFDYLYQKLPQALEAERAELQRCGSGKITHG